GTSPVVRRRAVTAIGRLGPEAALPRLLIAYRDPETRSIALAGLVQTPDVRALGAYLDGLSGKDALVRQACSKAIETIRDEALPHIERSANRLPPIVISQLLRIYANHAGAAKIRLFTAAAASPSPESYMVFTLEHAGDSARGRALFRERD